MADVWYYASGDESVGPLSLADLKKILSYASSAKSVMVWHNGLAEWRRAQDVEELAQLFIKPPPIKPAKQKSSIPPISAPAQSADRTFNAARATPGVSEPSLATASVHTGAHQQSPAYRLHKAELANRVLAVATIALIVGFGWRMYLFEQVRDLARLYGWGSIPASSLPGGLQVADTIILVSGYIWFALLWICMMCCYYEVFVVLRERFAQQFRYSFVVTVGSIFIPIIGLFRPWLGLGEIRRNMIGVRYKITRRFDFFTLTVALIFIFGLATQRVTSEDEEKLAFTSISVVGEAINYEMTRAILFLVIGVVIFIYCHSVIAGTRDSLDMKS